jgi:hypothetical protein
LNEDRKHPSSEEMWKVIERFGIKREMLEKHNTTNEEIFDLYQLIKKRLRDKNDQKMVKILQDYVEKLKSRNHQTDG